MLVARRLRRLVILAIPAVSSIRLDAQSAPSASDTVSRIQALVLVSGDSADKLRLAQLDGRRPLDGLMLRSTSTLTDPRRSGLVPRQFTLVLPYVSVVSNSELPFGQNDGALWAGKGANVRGLAGFILTSGPLRVVAIPEFAHSSNGNLSINPLDRKFAPALPESRSGFSSPFNVYPYSVDLPYRMGDRGITKIYPGQSSLTLVGGAAEIGVATENVWWGPALRNALLLSDNGPGFPHALIRTAHPLASRFGRVEASYVLGALHESSFFDKDASNDVRSISALGLSWRAGEGSGLTLGIARAVVAPVEGYGGVPARLFDFLRNVGHPDARALQDSVLVPGPDQIVSLFGRWALPGYGLETYLEWARADFPVSLRDFLEQPNHSRGYTAGLQWTHSGPTKRNRFRVLGEITSTEQSSTYRFRPIGSFYTSRAVPQGFTNGGQILGSGLGPGSSGGFLALDYFRGPLQGGLTFGRTRFNNDAFFLLAYSDRCGHDVITYPGVRGSFSNRRLRVSVEFISASRYNTFFQNKGSCEAGGAGSDRHNNQLSVTMTALGW